MGARYGHHPWPWRLGTLARDPTGGDRHAHQDASARLRLEHDSGEDEIGGPGGAPREAARPAGPRGVLAQQSCVEARGVRAELDLHVLEAEQPASQREVALEG